VRHYVTYIVLLLIKAIARLFWRFEVGWVGGRPRGPWWQDITICAILHHTSLYELILASSVPRGFLWRIASKGVVPVADKTLKRPLVGRLFRLAAGNVVSITRRRDDSWSEVLEKVSGDVMMVILPEGRMMRANGLDASGQPMTVRGGIADLVEAVPSGHMLMAYSGGLHHVQVPGQTFPRLWKTVRINFQLIPVAEYRQAMGYGGERREFRANVVADMERLRDRYCPTDQNAAAREIAAGRATEVPESHG
jgi:hypothetical protein